MKEKFLQERKVIYIVSISNPRGSEKFTLRGVVYSQASFSCWTTVSFFINIYIRKVFFRLRLEYSHFSSNFWLKIFLYHRRRKREGLGGFRPSTLLCGGNNPLLLLNNEYLSFILPRSTHQGLKTPFLFQWISWVSCINFALIKLCWGRLHQKTGVWGPDYSANFRRPGWNFSSV